SWRPTPGVCTTPSATCGSGAGTCTIPVSTATTGLFAGVAGTIFRTPAVPRSGVRVTRRCAWAVWVLVWLVRPVRAAPEFFGRPRTAPHHCDNRTVRIELIDEEGL